MTWVRLDDRFWSNPKLARVSARAHRLYTRALSYCGDRLSDGALSAADAVMLDSFGSADAAGRHHARSNGGSTVGSACTELVKAGLWKATAAGYLVNDFLQYNPSRAQILSEREAARERWELRGKQRRSNGEATAKHEPASPTPTRPGLKTKSSALSRNSASPEADPGLPVEEYTDPAGRLRFRPRTDQPPPPELPPVEDDDSPADLPDQTDPTTADNLPQEPW